MLEKLEQLFAYNKAKYENMLDDPHSKAGVFFDAVILWLVISFPFVLIFESLGNNAYEYSTLLLYIDGVMSIIFALEYFYRMYHAKSQISFAASPMRIIDLLSFAPFFLWFFAQWNFLKVLRILRALRVLRLVKRIPLTAGFVNSLKDYADEYRAVFTLYLIILFLGSFFVYFVEKDAIWNNFSSILDALWWGLVTMTTVWYGDMYPVTWLGKAIGSSLVFLWPLLGSLIWAVTFMVFVDTANHLNEKKVHTHGKLCDRCKTKNQRSANYCMKCWEKLTIIE